MAPTAMEASDGVHNLLSEVSNKLFHKDGVAAGLGVRGKEGQGIVTERLYRA